MDSWTTCPHIIYKNTERNSAHSIFSWPNPKQSMLVHTSDLMMIIRQSVCIFSIITREMGKLQAHSSTYRIMDNWEIITLIRHKKARFDSKMHGSTQKSPVRHKNAQYDTKMPSPACTSGHCHYQTSPRPFCEKYFFPILFQYFFVMNQ